MITFLVHLYQTTGIIGAAQRTQSNEEAGYTKLNGAHGQTAHTDGVGHEAEAYELTEHELSSGDEDATKIGGEDEVDWMDPDRREARAGVRL